MTSPRPDSYLVRELSTLRREVQELRRSRVSYMQAEVTDTDSGSSTFTAQVNGADGNPITLSGVSAPTSFLPTIGDTVLLALSGAQPIYQPGGIAAGAVGSIQIANGAVGATQLGAGSVEPEHLSFDLGDFTGSTIYYDDVEPTAPAGGFRLGDLWLEDTGGSEYVVYRWDGTDWVALQDQGVAQALANAINAENLANAKNTIYTQADAPTGLTPSDAGDLWVDTDDSNRIRTWDGTGWVDRLLGNGAISPNSLIASDVIATGTITAALFEAQLVLANTLIAGDVDGERSQLDATGLRCFAVDPSDGMETEIGYFGRSLSVRNPETGLVVATVGEDGSITGTDLNVDNPDPTFGGLLLSDRLWEQAWGNVGFGVIPDSNSYTTATNTEAQLFEMAFTLVPGRAYALRTEPIQWECSTAPGVRVQVRYTTDGSNPTLSSTVLRQIAYAPTPGAAWVSRHPLNLYLGGIAKTAAEQTWRLLFTYGSGNGATNVKAWLGDVMYFWIEDIGPLAEDIGVLRAGAGGGGGTSTAKTTKEIEFGATWTRSWRQGGTVVSFDDPMYQGYGDSFNGAQQSACGFPSLTSTLSGATINNIWIYLYAEHWYYYSGGIARMGYHSSLAEPASFPGHTNNNGITFTARGQGKWIDVTSWNGGAWKTALQNGTFRGISLAPPSTAPTYYGRFSGASKGRPRIRVRYTK